MLSSLRVRGLAAAKTVAASKTSVNVLPMVTSIRQTQTEIIPQNNAGIYIYIYTFKHTHRFSLSLCHIHTHTPSLAHKFYPI